MGVAEPRSTVGAMLTAAGLDHPRSTPAIHRSRREQQRAPSLVLWLKRPRHFWQTGRRVPLDDETAEHVVGLLVSASRRGGATVIVATHDAQVAGALSTYST